MNEFLLRYGALGFALLSAIDHTGVPAPLIVALELKEKIDLNDASILLIFITSSTIGDIIMYILGRIIPGKKILSKNKIEKIFKIQSKYGAASIIMFRFIPLFGRYLYVLYGVTKYNFLKFSFTAFLGSCLMAMIFYISTSLLSELFLIQKSLWLSVIAIVAIQILIFGAISKFLKRKFINKS